jgi:hypothetical protein
MSLRQAAPDLQLAAAAVEQQLHEFGQPGSGRRLRPPRQLVGQVGSGAARLADRGDRGGPDLGPHRPVRQPPGVDDRPLDGGDRQALGSAPDVVETGGPVQDDPGRTTAAAPGVDHDVHRPGRRMQQAPERERRPVAGQPVEGARGRIDAHAEVGGGLRRRVNAGLQPDQPAGVHPCGHRLAVDAAGQVLPGAPAVRTDERGDVVRHPHEPADPEAHPVRPP